MSTPDMRLRISGPQDVVATLPHLLGFHPQDSVAFLVVDESGDVLAARLDLPHTGGGYDGEVVAYTVARLAREGRSVFIVGYGTAERADPIVDLFTGALTAAGMHVRGAIRVTDGRYYHLRCDTCPPDGTVFDPAASPLAAGIAPLPSRAALERLIDPVTGAAHAAMAVAGRAALRRLTALLHETSPARTGGTFAEWVAAGPPAPLVEAGVAAVEHAYQATAAGRMLADDDAAWLAAVLKVPEVLDHAWRASDGSDAHRELWTDITRRTVLPATTPGPAVLLATTAFLAGAGALAYIAVDRALDADPYHHLAVLLHAALDAGVTPREWQDATNRRTT